MKKSAVLLAFAALLAGCANKTDNAEAVRQGVMKDVSKGLNVASMDVTVQSVKFRGDEADATVSFAPKGMPAAQGVTMSYVMAKKDGEWHIKSRNSGHAVEGGGAMPGGMPADHGGMGSGGMGGGMGMGDAGGAPQGGTMPPGHPAVGGGASGMPSPESVGSMPAPAQGSSQKK